MNTFLDFEKEVNSGKIRKVYYIAAGDNYFISKAGEILREKLFGSKDSKENFFLKYADETPMQELFDLTQSGASLFSAQKLVIVKRCEKYSRKLQDFLSQSKISDDDSVILYSFDTAFVYEKKLYESSEFPFYDFSELPQRELYNWVRDEFTKRDISINNDALDLFITSIPGSFDLLVTEIDKISNYDFEGNERAINKEIILQFIGYDKDYSPDELMNAVFSKNSSKSYDILNNLLNSKGLNEVYLLSMISKYYFDILSFKSRGVAQLDNRTLYQKYKLWGDSLKIAKNHYNSININSLENSISKIINTDRKLKTSMLNAKILMTSLVEDLINA